jgi:anti-sigma regulatory factor (Ser/Thr protein kinase)
MARLQLRLAPVPSAPADARRAMAAWMTSIGASGRGTDDAVIVMSELVTNGLVHDGGDDIIVRADRIDGTLCIDVVTVPLRPGTAPYPRPNVGADETARGMVILEALCREVTTTQDPSGRRTLTCQLWLDAGRAPGR